MCEHYPEETAIDYRRGLLSDAESAAFTRHLRECEVCREAVAEAEAMLQLLQPQTVEPGPAAHARVLREIRRERVRCLVTQPAAVGHHRALRIAVSWAAVAASVLLAIGLYALRSRTPSGQAGPAVVAQLTVLTHDVVVRRHGVQQQAIIGMPLYRDDAIVASSDATAVVVLADSTRVEIGPQTTLALSKLENKDGELRLESGFLSVEAAHRPADQPLCISTPKATARVLGTHFTLAASSRRTNVRVEQGRVRLTRSRDGASLELPAGYRSSAGDAGPLASMPTRSGMVLVIVSRENADESWERFNQLLRTCLLSDRLRQLSLDVEVKDHREVRAEDLANRPFVIVGHAAVGTRLEESLQRIHLAEAAVPVICMKAIALPVLRMSGPQDHADYRYDEPRLPMSLRNPIHSLSAGLAESSLNQVPCYGWAVPGPGAAIIAGIAHVGCSRVAEPGDFQRSSSGGVGGLRVARRQRCLVGRAGGARCPQERRAGGQPATDARVGAGNEGESSQWRFDSHLSARRDLLPE
ncbi:MAG: FecR domain-containing protein [Planctomycetota bacterium]|nr:FecR domain-containing protein [Planctomycetota bacterium]